jgi:hypothetical protein
MNCEGIPLTDKEKYEEVVKQWLTAMALLSDYAIRVGMHPNDIAARLRDMADVITEMHVESN